jgi:hypothetical protein
MLIEILWQLEVFINYDSQIILTISLLVMKLENNSYIN